MTTLSKLPLADAIKEQALATFNTQGDFSNITWHDMETAIGPNAHTYRALWDRVSSPDKKKRLWAHFSPCWSGIPFMGVSWAIARRMYPLAVMLMAGLVLLNIALPHDSDAPRILAIAIVVSFTHKSTYLRWLAHCIARINQQGLEGPEREAALRSVGGLDQKSGWIAACAFLALFALASVLGG